MRQVFISYSHESVEHKGRVHALAAELRQLQLNVVIDADMLPGGPNEGWRPWAQKQVETSDCVLVICTAGYGAGRGSTHEAGMISDILYAARGSNPRFRVVLFDDGDADYIPADLVRYHRYETWRNDSKAELIAWVCGTPKQSSQTVALQWPAASANYVWPLADRREVFADFQEMLTGASDARILLLKGVSNRGKTVLLTELRDYARNVGIAVAWLDFKGTPSLDEILELMRLDLGDLMREPANAVGPARLMQVMSDLQRLSVPVVLIFDTYENASPDCQKWLESQFLPRLDKAAGAIVIIGGQHAPAADKFPWGRLARYHELRPIEQTADWLEYMNRKWPGSRVTAQHIEALTIAFGGDPGKVSACLITVAGNLQGRT